MAFNPHIDPAHFANYELFRGEGASVLAKHNVIVHFRQLEYADEAQEEGNIRRAQQLRTAAIRDLASYKPKAENPFEQRVLNELYLAAGSAFFYTDQSAVDEAFNIVTYLNEKDPKNVHAKQLLGMLYFEDGRFDEAERITTEGFELDRTHFGNALTLAETLHKTGKHQQAQNIYMGLSTFAASIAEERLAYDTLSRAIPYGRTIELQIQLARIDLMLDHPDRALGSLNLIAPSDDSAQSLEEYILRGSAHYRLEDFETAIEIYQTAKANAQSEEAFDTLEGKLKLARVARTFQLIELGQYDQAKRVIDPFGFEDGTPADDGEYFLNLANEASMLEAITRGVAYHYTGEASKARNVLVSVLRSIMTHFDEHNPIRISAEADANYWLGEVEQADGRIHQARDHFSQFLEASRFLQTQFLEDQYDHHHPWDQAKLRAKQLEALAVVESVNTKQDVIGNDFTQLRSEWLH